MSASSIYSASPLSGGTPPRPAHMPAHYSSYPGAAAASISHNRFEAIKINELMSSLYRDE